jgi:hypothetical protein
MLSAKKRQSEKRLALGVRRSAGVSFVAPEKAEDEDDDEDDLGGEGKEPDPSI